MICRPLHSGTVAAPRAFHRVFCADPLSVRRTLADLCGSVGSACSEDALGRLQLVLAEVLNNIVEHGFRIDRQPGAIIAGAQPEGAPARSTVHLLVRIEADAMRCVITDTGVLLPGACLAARSLPRRAPDLPEGGFGWYLIQDLVDQLSYSRTGGRNFLAFTLPLEDSVAAVA